MLWHGEPTLLLVVMTAKSHSTSLLATASSVSTTRRTKKLKNLLAPHSMQQARLVLSVTSTGSTSTTSTLSALSGMRLCAKRLRTTTQWLHALGARTDQRYLWDHFVAQSIFSKFALKNVVIRVNLNLHMSRSLKFWSAELRMVRELCWSQLMGMRLQRSTFIKTASLLPPHTAPCYSEIWKPAKWVSYHGVDQVTRSLTFQTPTSAWFSMPVNFQSLSTV